MKIYDLRCEDLADPLGLDSPAPRLAWRLRSDRRGDAPAAYRMLAASTPEKLAAHEGDLWDSGQTVSDQVRAVYAGKPLGSSTRAHWKVMVWGADGTASAWSPAAWWETGLLKPKEWTGTWIGAALVGGPKTSTPLPFLRTTFTVDKPVVSARLYASALGLFECELNGKRVGDDAFAPGWTMYDKRIPYRTYDVTALVQRGENAWGTMLGDGWYCGFVGLGYRQTWGDRPKFLAQLRLTFADGTQQTVATGPEWKTAFGPLVGSDMFMGEDWDARLESPGWSTPGYDQRGWNPVVAFEKPEAPLVWSPFAPIRPQGELKPVAPPKEFKGWPKSTWVFDFGQNLVGRVRLKVRGNRGLTVTLRHAEILNPDGTLYTTNLRSARSEDRYTLKGDGEETFESRFTFHGFRYVSLYGPEGAVTAGDVTAVVLHSELAPAGTFECSNPLVNQLQHNIEWGLKGNFLEIPTDCPQRDERLGWTGDIQVFASTALFNRDVAAFLRKWLRDLADSQAASGGYPSVAPNPKMEGAGGVDGGPAWADAGAIVPWTAFLASGDPGPLREHYPSLAKFLGWLETSYPDGVRGDPAVTAWGGYGDWLSIDAETPKDLIGTAFLARSARLGARMAAALNLVADEARWTALAEKGRAAFQRRYVAADGTVASGTQTANVLALHFDLLQPEFRARAVEALVADIRARGNKLSCGFVGSSYLPHVLSDNDRLEVAYDLLNQHGWPSWLYAVTQGATTIWERWDGWTHDRGFQDAGMNSFNHYAYGAIGAWLYRVVAGIDLDPDRPGYARLLLRPRPGGGLTAARATHESPWGRVESGWRIEHGTFHWDVLVPPGAVATIHVPAKSADHVREGGGPAASAAGLSFLRYEHGAAVFEAASGRYAFIAAS